MDHAGHPSFQALEDLHLGGRDSLVHVEDSLLHAEAAMRSQADANSDMNMENEMSFQGGNVVKTIGVTCMGGGTALCVLSTSRRFLGALCPVVP